MRPFLLLFNDISFLSEYNSSIVMNGRCNAILPESEVTWKMMGQVLIMRSTVRVIGYDGEMFIVCYECVKIFLPHAH